MRHVRVVVAPVRIYLQPHDLHWVQDQHQHGVGHNAGGLIALDQVAALINFSLFNESGLEAVLVDQAGLYCLDPV